MKSFLKYTTLLFLILVLVFPVGIGATPLVHAQGFDSGSGGGNDSGSGGFGAAAGGVLGCAASGVAIGAGVGAAAAAAGLVVPVNDAAVTTNTGTEVSKECILDGLAVVIREVLISNITASIVNWINNGFEGEPAFIADLEGFLLDVADQVVGTYIEGSELAFLCSPFDIDVKIALALDYYAPVRDRTSCTLTGVIDNVKEAFDDFKNDSAWDSWFQFTINPNNNAYGSFIQSRQDLRRSIAQRQSAREQELAWGNGFRSLEVCDAPTGNTATDAQAPVFSGRVNGARINCRIVTPGVVINDQLNNVLGSGQQQLELADEINEIIGALLGQLAQQVLGGSSRGLRGLSSGGNGRPSYVTRLTERSEQRAESEFRSFGLDTVNQFISTEQQFASEKKISIERLNASESLLQSVQQCYADKLSSPTLNLSATQRETAQQRIENASSTIQSSITPLKTLFESEVAQAEDTISELLVIRENLQNALGRTAVERIIETQLNPLVENRVVHDQEDFFAALKQKQDVENLADSLDQATQAKINTCNAFPPTQSSTGG